MFRGRHLFIHARVFSSYTVADYQMRRYKTRSLSKHYYFNIM